MRLELRSTRPAVCERCGSHELLRIRRTIGSPPEELAVELGLTLKLPRWAFIRRRMLSDLDQLLRNVEYDLIESARYPKLSVQEGTE